MRRAHHQWLHVLEALGLRRHDEGGDAPAATFRVGGGEHDVNVGDAGIRDEGLGAVQHVAAVVPDSGGRHGSHVGAGLGLTHREGTHGRAVEQLGEPSLTLVGVVAEKERRARECLDGVDRIGQRVGTGQNLAGQAGSALVLSLYRAQPSPGAQQCQDLQGLATAGVVVGRLGKGGHALTCKGRDGLRPFAVRILEKGAHSLRIEHHTNRASRFSVKASYASRKFGFSIHFA